MLYISNSNSRWHMSCLIVELRKPICNPELEQAAGRSQLIHINRPHDTLHTEEIKL